MLKDVRHIALTGASAGIGAALVNRLAAPGLRLSLAGRDQEALGKLAETARIRGAEVEISALDVRDGAMTEKWVQTVWRAAPVDVFIASAGLFAGSPEAGVVEAPDDAVAVLETNLLGAVVGASEMARAMAARGQGRIVLLSSVAALIPQADAAAYSASKAGLTAYSAALRELLEPAGVAVSVVHPGHVRTRQTQLQNGVMPMMIEPDLAADRILAGLAKGQAEIHFPRPIWWFARLHQHLPYFLRRWLNRPYRFTVRGKAP